jgi:hypothetical protein
MVDDIRFISHIVLLRACGGQTWFGVGGNPVRERIGLDGIL